MNNITVKSILFLVPMLSISFILYSEPIRRLETEKSISYSTRIPSSITCEQNIESSEVNCFLTIPLNGFKVKKIGANWMKILRAKYKEQTEIEEE